MKKSTAIFILLLTALLWNCQSTTTPDTEDTKIDPETEWKETGAEITAAVGKALLSTVQQKMSDEGVAGAIDYCRVNALPLTDSLAEKYNVKVKRTALLTRNDKNKPTAPELNVLSQMAAQEKPAPAIGYTTDNHPVYYEPIVLKEFCQTCHGIPGRSMTLETDSLIKSHYPLDRATGFSAGDFRGMWVVYFNEKAAL